MVDAVAPPPRLAAGSASDSPDTARDAVLRLHKRWVEAAGGCVACPAGVEVSPLLSCAGEGLEGLVAGRTYASEWADELQGRQ